MGVGAVALLSRNLKLGFSAQNINNKKVKNFSPRFYKLGVSWEVYPETLSVNLDYRRRSRIKDIEGSLDPIPGFELDSDSLRGLEFEEEMVYLGGKAKVYNLLRIDANYGMSLQKDDLRSSLSTSLGIYQNEYSFVYTLSQPYMEYSDLQSTISLQVFMKI